jgi:hypothetical protein
VKPKELKQMNEVKRAVEEVAQSLALLSSDMKTLEPQDLMMNARRLASLLPLLDAVPTIDRAGWFAIKVKVFLEKFPHEWLEQDPRPHTTVDSYLIADLMRAAKKEGIAF